MTSEIHGQIVHGVEVRERTECDHYHSALDIIAIKFPCCGQFYPCYECHQAVADHPAQVWKRDQFEELAILCGNCGHVLAIREYLDCENKCPRCQSQFNPGCANHYGLYFDLGPT